MKTIFTLAFSAIAFIATAQNTPKPTSDTLKNEKNDTTKLRFGGLKMILINDHDDRKAKKDTSFHEVFNGKKDGKHKSKHTAHWAGFGMGFDGYLNNNKSFKMPKGAEYMDLKYSKCISVYFNPIEKTFPIYRNYVQIVTGLGIEWNNFRFSQNTSLVPNLDSLKGSVDPIKYSKSKLVTDYITVPLMLEFNTNSNPDKSAHITAGVIGAYLYRSHTKRVVEDSGNKVKDYDDFSLSPFRFSATARVGFGHYDVFANYGLNGLFQKDKGPDLHPFSVGITFIGF